MNNKRLMFHNLLSEKTGLRSIYFQPPSNLQMRYPCIVYSRNNNNTSYANDELYKYLQSYTVTIIDSNPDSEILDKILSIPFSRFNRHFTSDNLNHDVFQIYF